MLLLTESKCLKNATYGMEVLSQVGVWCGTVGAGINDVRLSQRYTVAPCISPS